MKAKVDDETGDAGKSVASASAKPARATPAKRANGAKPAGPRVVAQKSPARKSKAASSPKPKKAPTKAPAKKLAGRPVAAAGDATGGAGASASAAPPPTDGASASLLNDFDALSEYLADVTGKSQEVVREIFVKNAEAIGSGAAVRSGDPLNVGEAFQEVMTALAADPGTVMQRQFNLWGDYAKLMGAMSRRIAGEDVRPAIEPEITDKRFSHKAWRENPMLDFVKQSYLTYARWLKGTVSQLEGIDDFAKRRAEFFTQQFIDAIAPTNFPVLNPEVVEATIETKGENLLKGMRNLLADIDRGHGELAIRQADLEHFTLGVNIATTPGKVIYQNDIMQVIQYDPLTDEVARRPLLIFPPWINKFYILDLQPENSFIRWMVEQGRTVFVVSWVNPGPELAERTFADYIHEGCFEALDVVRSATGERDVDAIGYCIGGTMLATALAIMAKRGDDRIRSATFFTAQADFEEAGDLLLFVDEPQLEAIERQMDAAGGVLEGRAMASTFNMLRSNDLIWSFVIDNYMKGKDPAKFDLLFWNSDATRMPKNVHLFYLREFYQQNRLARGDMEIDGLRLDLADVKIPIFMQAGETDHIAPHNSVYRTARLFARGGNNDIVYMLAGSGHIAGVVNHPSKMKYHHSVNSALPETLAEWKRAAERRAGSWWPYWIDWLNRVSPERVQARWPGDGALGVIESAPGSYVKVKA